MRLKKAVACVVSGALAIGALSGCATFEDTLAKPTADPACAKAASPNPATPVVAVLRTTGPTDRPTTATNERALDKVIAGSEQLRSNLLVNGVNGTADPPNLRINTQMTGTGKNELRKTKDLECKIAAVKREFGALGKAPADRRLDLLSALRVLKRDLDGSTASVVHVVILASALQTETINLFNGQTLDNPAQAINLLADKQLNFRCPGWRVYLIGANRKGGQPVDAATDVKLKAWWSAYFARCGGNLVTYNNELATFPLGERTAEGADARRLAVSVKRTPTAVIATVGGDLLFDVNSARLRKGAEEGLDRMVPLLGEADGPITIAGHTDNTGTDTINDALSRARAETVAEWLLERSGLPRSRLRVVGRGSHEPIRSNASEAGRAKNRRVVVTIHRVSER